MADFTESVLVPAFFVHTAAGILATSAWFWRQSKPKMREFGIGLLGYGLGLTIWTVMVLVNPHDLGPWVLAGAIPFLLASIAFVRSATLSWTPSARQALTGLVLIGVIATFIVRTFIYESHPYFSDKGLFYFGLDPSAAALYLLTISASFLPAVLSVVREIGDTGVRNRYTVGLIAIYANAIVMLSSHSDTLLLINGIVLTAALIVLWSTSLFTPTRKA